MIESIMLKSLRAIPRSWTSATVIVIALMITTVIAGFAYIAHQQGELGAIRETSRVTRMARQALMETDAAVLNSLVHSDEQASVIAYARALNKLDSHPREHFPETSRIGEKNFRTVDLIESLKLTWAEMITETTAGRLESAQSIYSSRQVQPRMAGLVQTFVERIEALDTDYLTLQKQIDVTIILVMILQVVSGVLCIFAFTFAARRGAIESKARARAMLAATSSREQVLRLFKMTDMLQSASDQSDANAVLTSTAMELIPGFGGALYVFNNSRDRLVLSTSWALGDESKLVDSIGLQQCWALKRGKRHVNLAHAHKLSCEHHHGGDTVLDIPMAARGEVLGLLQIHADGDNAEKGLHEIEELGAAMADAMSLALANIALRDRLRSQALRDPLTGLYNRRYMEDTLERVVRLAEREQQEVSVIMIDLDHFKRLNDQYGHAKGDSVLRDAAAAVTAHLRETDVACRYGGEELIVVMPNCGADDAMLKAERIRASIESLSENGGAQVSASFGVSVIPTISGSIKDLLATSDAALYAAKEQGRNCVVCAQEKKSSPSRVRGRPVSRLRPEMIAAE